MTREQCFQHLDIPTNSSWDEIVKARKDGVLIWHPDRFPNNPELKSKAHTKMAQINAAYKFLLEDQAFSDGNEDYGTATRQTPDSEPTPVQPSASTRTRPSEPSPPSTEIPLEEWVAAIARIVSGWMAAIGREASEWMAAVAQVAWFWMVTIARTVLGCGAVCVVLIGLQMAYEYSGGFPWQRNSLTDFIELTFAVVATLAFLAPWWLMFRAFEAFDGTGEVHDDAVELEKSSIPDSTSPTKEAPAESFPEWFAWFIPVSVIGTAVGGIIFILDFPVYLQYISIVLALGTVGVLSLFIQWARGKIR